MLIDSNCNLASYDETELVALADDLRSNDIDNSEFSCLSLCWHKSQWKYNQSLACSLDFDVKVGVGFHPHHIDKKTDLKDLRQFVIKNKVDAIGEVGLDASQKHKTTIYTQLAVLKQSVEIAVENNIPIMFHIVKAHRLLMDILVKHGKKLPSFCVHDFIGNNRLIEEYQTFPVYFGINDTTIRCVVHNNLRKLGLNQILFESDSPSIYREKNTSFSSTVKHLHKNMQAFADITGRQFEDVKRANAENFVNFFKKNRQL